MMGEAGSALNDPLVLALLAGIGGFFIRELMKGRDGITSARVIDANVLARLEKVEEWQRDNRSLHADFQRLTAIVENLASNVAKGNDEMARSFDRLTRRVDGWMSSQPSARRRSPFDVGDMRDWIDPHDRRGDDDWRPFQ